MSTFGLVSYHSTPRIRFITCIWFDLVLSILIFRNNLYAKISTCLILIQQVIVFVPDSSYKLVISIYFVCITVPITSSQFDKIFRSFLLHAPPRTSALRQLLACLDASVHSILLSSAFTCFSSSLDNVKLSFKNFFFYIFNIVFDTISSF